MPNSMQQLLAYGQSVWLDNLRRSMFASGELKRLIENGLRGMTSNPTIFEKAIGAGNDYDEQLRSLIGSERDADALFWDLAVADIRSACDEFSTVYASSKGGDGFVSLEVSPLLARDTAGTIAMAKTLWKRVDRPNLMVKIPGTNEGIPAIEECIFAGININVTLIFAIEMYEKTAMAYVRGLERRIAAGLPVDSIASVNSVFVSRIDSAIDKLIQSRIDKGERLEHLLGKTGIANLKLTYQKFEEIFLGATFAKAKTAGARVQRPLWASTSTKNPQYADLMYVESVVGEHTVNTMPPATLDALLDHGHPQPATVREGLDEARGVMERLREIGISLFDVTHALQVEGVSLFSDSYAALLGAIVYKQKMLAESKERVVTSLGDLRPHVDLAIEKLNESDFLKRLWAKDATLWSDAPEHAEIIKHALGWLDIPQHLLESTPNLAAFAREVGQRFAHVVVLGMGGSSLAPDVLRATFGHQPGSPQLHILDSTDPAQILALEAKLDLARTLFIVASKSGSTTEPNAYFAYFHDKITKIVGAAKAGSHFVAITDAGTTMESVAKQHDFLAIYLNDPNIGGRYSALSYFGMLPAALAGLNVPLLLDRALGAMHANDRVVDPRVAPGVHFGATIGALALAGRDKLTILCHPSMASFGTWCEQLIAESTGKLGRGVIPVEGEALGAPGDYGNDRLFVYVGDTLPNPNADDLERLASLEAAGHPVVRLAMNDLYDIGEQFYLWEIATATVGTLLAIDAFDQPNVQESKDNTKSLLASYAQSGRIDLPAPNVRSESFDLTLLAGSAGIAGSDAATVLQALLGQIRPNDYVAITAYIERDDRHIALLDSLRVAIRNALRVATTVGFGPRFLHSTGQLHKGGPSSAFFIQIVADEPEDRTIPGMNVTFRTLLAAQALGDLQSLDKRARRGTRVHLNGTIDGALRQFIASVESSLTAAIAK
ncbi:MAG: bifunctional transaldolase/phosoglucose isomerase [Candidatus Baltobacteraceae bacterium]